jgi:hypothetical protein
VAVRCPCCGSYRVIEDPLTGNLVCQDCGCVIKENLIDDYAWKPPSKPRYPLRKRVLKQAIHLADTSMWGKRIPPTRATGILNQNPPDYIIKIMNNLPGIISVKERTRIALSYYIYERSEGNSKTGSLIVASKRTGVSVKTLTRILRRYRPWIEEVIRRVAVQWNSKQETQQA